ncbi:MAG: endonuclease/exonuclease/phosphatase family metal-dependent hydrolase [Urechidicola sp.]|jgi:endonuclease/exonuclease/phosphatase family metal-dependent hydrolase
MRILSWNVQYGKSPDNSFDFIRTLDYIKSLGEFDIICLQEVARHMPDYCIQGQEDQLLLSQQSFPDYRLIWGSGFNWPSVTDNEFDRQEFGNLTLIKHGLLDYRVHQLPQPATPGKLQMPRVAIEACIDSSIGPLSIINTHLAFHDSNETQLQLEHFTHLEQERVAHHQYPKAYCPGCFHNGYLASARILCGDYNFDPQSTHYQYQTDCGWMDAWKQGSTDEPHPSTCGVFDTIQWTQGGHCRDYFWLSNEFASYKINVSADSTASLSDHQPIILEIDV